MMICFYTFKIVLSGPPQLLLCKFVSEVIAMLYIFEDCSKSGATTKYRTSQPFGNSPKWPKRSISLVNILTTSPDIKNTQTAENLLFNAGSLKFFI